MERSRTLIGYHLVCVTQACIGPHVALYNISGLRERPRPGGADPHHADETVSRSSRNALRGDRSDQNARRNAALPPRMPPHSVLVPETSENAGETPPSKASSRPTAGPNTCR